MRYIVSRAGIVAAAAAAALLAAGAGVHAGGSGEQTSPRTAPEEILVSPEWIAERAENIVVLEVGRDFEEFEAGHVPGAVYVEGGIIATERDGVGGLLPEPETVAADLADLGVSNDTPVVVYDAGHGTWAGRLFWALEYLGHQQVHLLDGGLTAWDQAQMELSREIRAPERGDFTAEVRDELLADQEYVEDTLDGDEVLILDARSPEEYRGEDVRAERGGHIPGAVNLNWVNNTRDDDPRFRPLEELAEVYEEAMTGYDGEVVTLCQAGFRAAHSYVALRVLGHENARMYDGSWAEWGNDADTPIETGAPDDIDT
ncbi:MAG: sulfurtransferase [Spirochaetaceae bacterium]